LKQAPAIFQGSGDGSRVAAMIPPCSLGGVTLTIRKFNARHFEMEDLITYHLAIFGGTARSSPLREQRAASKSWSEPERLSIPSADIKGLCQLFRFPKCQ
jgi:hypothetical protein